MAVNNIVISRARLTVGGLAFVDRDALGVGDDVLGAADGQSVALVDLVRDGLVDGLDVESTLRFDLHQHRVRHPLYLQFPNYSSEASGIQM